MRPQAIGVLVGTGLALVVAFPADAGDTGSQIRGLRSRVSTLERKQRLQAQLNLKLVNPPLPLIQTAVVRAVPRGDGYAYAVATCPAGKVRTGGGATWETGHSVSDVLLSSGPDGESGWLAEGLSRSGTALTVSVECES